MITILTIVLIAICLFSAFVAAAPYNGTVFQFKQPDNTYVDVNVFGDEFYQRVESLDGYTLCRDVATGYICYAKYNADASDFVSTGVIYRGTEKNQANDVVHLNTLKVNKGMRLNKKYILDKVHQSKQLLHLEAAGTVDGTTSSVTSLSAPLPAAPTGTIHGLAVLINFPDQSSSIGKTEIDNMLNQTGYSNYNNKGSVKDYYYDVSGGKVTYTNYVTDFYTAKHPKSYYTDPSVTYAYRAAELLQEALTDLNNRGFDFSTLTTDANKNILAINAYYAGQPDSDWGKGLWPHQGNLPTRYNVDGVICGRYQMSNIGTSLVIGTTCHEDGHLIFSWPDLYDYDGDSAGAGTFCIMSYDNATNPQVPNPYLRYSAGWISYTNLNTYPNGSQITVNSGSLGAYSWTGSASNEYFLVENIRRTGRWAALPGEGLLIWHIETRGNNSYNQMTSSQHFIVSVEQADGLFHLEHDNNSGQASDFYYSGNKTLFDNTTTPNSNWWSGSASGLRISNVGPIGNTITFTLGNGNPLTPSPTPVRTATPTPGRTATPVLTATPTPLRTATPRTVTPTPTPVRTATPGTGTATPTPVRTATPGLATPTPPPGTGSIKVQFYNQNTAATSNQLYLNFQLVNTGSSAITLSNVKLRYYYTKDGTQAQTFYCDYAQAGGSNITGTFVTMSTAKTGADSYLEVGFGSGAGSLAAGAGTVIQSRVAKSDWSNYTQTNDYSFNATGTSYADWTKVTGYVSGALQWGVEP
jgi:M6 family metalloprotease-like protein